MKNYVIASIVIVLVLLCSLAESANHSFARRDYIAALADSSNKILPDPEDTCVNCPSRLEAKSVIPGSRIDSLKMALSYEESRWQPNPTKALFLSMFIPGGGQFYNRSYIKSVVYAGTQIYLVKYIAWRWKWMNRHKWNFQNSDDEDYQAEQFALFEEKQDSRNLHLWLISLTTLVSMFDAYVDAHLSDFDQADKAFEVFLEPKDEKLILNLVYTF